MPTLHTSAGGLPRPRHGGWVPLSAAPGLVTRLSRERAALAGPVVARHGRQLGGHPSKYGHARLGRADATMHGCQPPESGG